ncbi:uncharacterized protein LOC118606833 [Rousettus aegyptiacus]|uniref:uncharacterized protein LOC118606833 n=1 Tax=Rousettus aegyptiacus TaxID=9407 RepID=UPI00168D1E42|nr:uncharacterized protein LOC118606833 [Rousettus aegyptiacus]
MEEKQAAQNRMIHVLASRHPRPKLGQEEFCHQTRLRGEKAHPRRKPQERHPPRHPHSVPSAMGPARSDLVSCTKMWLVECSALPLQAGHLLSPVSFLFSLRCWFHLFSLTCLIGGPHSCTLEPFLFSTCVILVVTSPGVMTSRTICELTALTFKPSARTARFNSRLTYSSASPCECLMDASNLSLGFQTTKVAQSTINRLLDM